MNRFQAAPYEDQSEINLSPMLDVVFIMLIFFIVVATFIDEKGLSVTLAPEAQIIEPVVESIVVQVGPDGSFVINGRAMSSASVKPYVQALYAENPEAGYGVLLAPGSIVKDAMVAVEAGREIGIEVVPVTRE